MLEMLMRKQKKTTIDPEKKIEAEEITKQLLNKVPEQHKLVLAKFICDLYEFYMEYYFTYLEINPLVVKEDKVYPLDLAAKVDQTAEFICGEKWGKLEFPAPFGRAATPEEQYIAELDSKTGASLKLTILNAEGLIWTMVAGGGASVVYADTISDLGYGKELANYGEYSGDPSEVLTYEYAKTILGLMTMKNDPRGKILIIGGGIANFTNVAETFKGIVRAITHFKQKLIETKVKIFVRRGGPNYQEGLQMMKDCGIMCGIPIEVFGPETHVTSIVSYALGVKKPNPILENKASANMSSTIKASLELKVPSIHRSNSHEFDLSDSSEELKSDYTLFTRETASFVYGMQPKAVQNMLDFDHVCGRKRPSVVAMVYPFSGGHYQKFYWGTSEILIPVYQKVSEAVARHKEVEVMVNFSSFRSVFESTMEGLSCPQIKTIAIIAEGVPENQTKILIKRAHEKKVVIIGPATVGGIKPGAFRVGNTGGMIDNIIASKLYRPGSIAYVSRSGGMSNELNNIISRNSDGVYEGVAIGGDRYPGTTFMDHILRYQSNPDVKIIVLLGEVGGIDEYVICEALESKKITKPLIAWCMGTCAKMFPYEVQFGHAGALARGKLETSDAKNAAMKKAGAIVPESFEEFGDTIHRVYSELLKDGTIVERPEPEPPVIPMDYHWAQKLGLIRKPTSFISTISDERGDELIYSGVPISKVLEEELGIGGVISLLWFKRRLPKYATKYIEMVLMVTADHGPAVSGAHNTIVTARAGKDLISSVVSGLMTIGPRFGGAIDGAAEQFSWAYDTCLTPKQFVAEMRKQNKLIMGIGHLIKTIDNTDKRVAILKQYAKKEFPSTPILDYALEVEKLTTSKKPNLILNVDGLIGTSFVDLLRGCGAFTREEADSLISHGCLNGLFVLGRSVGLIGHYLDQTRLKQPLYRHPWDDIAYADEQSYQ
jgi:ATP citrate (pro-S)-lyase